MVGGNITYSYDFVELGFKEKDLAEIKAWLGVYKCSITTGKYYRGFVCSLMRIYKTPDRTGPKKSFCWRNDSRFSHCKNLSFLFVPESNLFKIFTESNIYLLVAWPDFGKKFVKSGKHHNEAILRSS